MYYTATTEIHTYCHPLSLHDALPLCWPAGCRRSCPSLTSSASKRYSTKTFSNLYGRGLSMDVREGGCLCGAVRYRIRAAPRAVVICHCTHCQRASGSALSVNLLLEEGDYDQHGETKFFLAHGDRDRKSVV